LKLLQIGKLTATKNSKKKPNPGIKDIEECYKFLLKDTDGKILLLIDEAGALDKGFFKNDQEKTGLFEILMNQFRTASFIRTKVAVYPNSYSDMLNETRYGDVVMLENSIIEEQDYKRLRKKAIDIINNYINPKNEQSIVFKAHNVFDINHPEIYGDALEHILYASHGNMRRLINLLDMSMDAAYSDSDCAKKVEKNNVTEALKKHAAHNESGLNAQEKEFLDDLVNVCRSRSAYKFSFPNVPLYKYTSRSKEYNIINIDEAGSGRKATIYSFDFSYCVLKDIPTHRMNDDERVYKERSGDLGRWSSRKAIMSQELIKQASLPGKIEGVVKWFEVEYQRGFIKIDTPVDEKIDCFFQCKDIIEDDKNKIIHIGTKLRFYPLELEGNDIVAHMIEVLE